MLLDVALTIEFSFEHQVYNSPRLSTNASQLRMISTYMHVEVRVRNP